MIIGCLGPEGGGKSALMTYLCEIHYARGGEIWAFPGYDVYLPYRYNTQQRKISHEITTVDWVDLGPQYDGGLFAIDEIQNFFGSEKWNSAVNRLFSAMMAQRRKRGLAVIYTVQNTMWVDNRVRWLTHISAYCRDTCFTPWGREQKLERGQKSDVTYIDNKGFFTGFENQLICQATLNVRALWDCFNSYAVISPWEGMTRVKFRRPEIEVDLRGQGLQPDGLLTAADFSGGGLDEV